MQNAQQGGNHSSEGRHTTQRRHLRCANCDIEILWPPIVVQEKTYCCTGCAAGGPCNCDYSLYRSVNISGVIHYLDNEISTSEWKARQK